MFFASRLRAIITLTVSIGVLAALDGRAAACGFFYVARTADKLAIRSSKVVLSRDGRVTAVTMASDYHGEPKEFAVVVPVPTLITRKQIGVVDMKTIEHLDAFTSPNSTSNTMGIRVAPQLLLRPFARQN